MVITLLHKVSEKILIGRGRLKIFIYSTLVIVLSILFYFTYVEYKNIIVAQQQQQMLGVAKSISRSIELYTDTAVDSMKIITLNKEFISDVSKIEQRSGLNAYNEKLKAYYEAKGDVVTGVYFFDYNGNPLIQYPQSSVYIDNNIQSDINNALAQKKTYFGRAYMDKSKNYFILNIYEPVFDGDNFKGVLCVAINLDVIYDKLIDPLKIGQKGYAQVKDQEGIILMHQVKEQVGINVIDTRKQLYPDLNFDELEDLIKHQLKGEEGTAIYQSYWWDGEKPKGAKKLNAYTPVHLGDYFWVVAVTMSYDEIQAPITRFLWQIIGIFSLISMIIYVFFLALAKAKKNKEELEKETKYLKMLNEASEQLRKKEAELFHSNKLKMIGTLAGGIAHDINNLLTPILGYSELLLMRLPEDSEYHEEVKEILKASEKGRDLIEQILLFSRNDSGILKVEKVDANEVTKETIKLFKAFLPKNIKVIENIEENCGHINANFSQIHQVIFNLCSNAYQAMKNKEGEVEISLRTLDREEVQNHNGVLQEVKCYIELTVRDTGCGMDHETKSRIFEPFFTTKDIGDGTGLGLFVVQSIIDKYEGVIEVESEVGVGSCFKVYFPLIDEEENEKEYEDYDIISNDSNTILLVDDNEKNTKVLKKGLEHLGYIVITETDSLKALNIFQSEYKKIDLVITDYVMPGLKGSELAERIKEIKKNTGVIVITGYIDESENAIKDNKCIDACISKPIELAKLSDIVRKVLVDIS